MCQSYWYIFKVLQKWGVLTTPERLLSLLTICTKLGSAGPPWLSHSHTEPVIVQISALFIARIEETGFPSLPRICYSAQTDSSVSVDLFLRLYVCDPSRAQSSLCVRARGGGHHAKKHLFDCPEPPQRFLPAGSSRGRKGLLVCDRCFGEEGSAVVLHVCKRASRGEKLR